MVVGWLVYSMIPSSSLATRPGHGECESWQAIQLSEAQTTKNFIIYHSVTRLPVVRGTRDEPGDRYATPRYATMTPTLTRES